MPVEPQTTRMQRETTDAAISLVDAKTPMLLPKAPHPVVPQPLRDPERQPETEDAEVKGYIAEPLS